tara:strand:- start:4760 stop:6412 length:1653 start_codon:yes stop_codon:yes gene_type:complete
MIFKKNMVLKNIYEEKIIIPFFFIIYFIIGIFIVRDYGIAFDENMQREIGQNRIDYIIYFFSNLFSRSINSTNDLTTIKWPEYGAFFEVFALFIEKIFNFSDTRSQFFLRHHLIFLTSFVGSFFFYLLAMKRFKSWKIALLGLILLITSPRIFSSSFYNSKDIILMYFFVISTFFGIIFLEKPTLKNAIFFSLTSALCIGIRVAGIIVPFLILFLIWIKYLRKDYEFKITKSVILFTTLSLFLVILFWPSLWENPLENFIDSIISFKTYDHPLFNFYLGNYTHSTAVHWYYIPLWIGVTTPILILFFFLLGSCISLFRIYRRLIRIDGINRLNDLWRGPTELLDLIFIILIFVPVFFIVVFGSTLYSGWRHLYFIFPYIILMSLYGINLIFLKIKKLNLIFFKKSIYFVIIFCIFYNFYWLIKSHPFQNSYFNFFAGNLPHKNFQVDSWGLSNRYLIEKILKEDDRSKISISAISVTSLGHNFNILSADQKKRIKYAKNLQSSDYIVVTNNFIWGDYWKLKKLPTNFKVYHELFIDDILVTTLYKRRDSQ